MTNKFSEGGTVHSPRSITKQIEFLQSRMRNSDGTEYHNALDQAKYKVGQLVLISDKNKMMVITKVGLKIGTYRYWGKGYNSSDGSMSTIYARYEYQLSPVHRFERCGDKFKNRRKVKLSKLRRKVKLR